MTQQTTETDVTDVMRTVTEAMRQLGIKKTKFYELINAGVLEAHDINGVQKRHVGETGPRRSLRIPQSEIDRFLAETKISAT